MGEKRKTPSEGFLLSEGMEPFWLKERFPTVPEAMGEEKKDFFPQLLGTVEKAGAARSRWGWKTYCGAGAPLQFLWSAESCSSTSGPGSHSPLSS